jgi:endonuclease YncB( thermonuclease family)
LALAIVAAGLGTSPAMAQAPLPATVTHVVDGDTLDAQLPDGKVVRVRLIGIDAPERGECGFEVASEYMESIALDHQVALVTDPTQPEVDSYGRSLFYVDRTDGVDLGLRMLQTGWALVDVDWGIPQRNGSYVDAETAATGGVWRFCDGDVHAPVKEAPSEADQLRVAAAAFIRRYYRRVSNRQFQTAWGMLGRQVRRDIGTFTDWRLGHRRSRGVSVLGVRARLSRNKAVVNVRIRSRDRDACSGRMVRQSFGGFWVLAPRRGSWIAVRARMRKTGGADPRLSKSECAPRPHPTPIAPRPPPPPRNCQGYSPCLTPGADVDCAGGEGNGPRYADGPVYVSGSDPYGLDGDGDGVACE